MRKVTMPNFYINFLNKTVKSLSILCDFAVAPFTGAWIKIVLSGKYLSDTPCRTLHGCVD